MLNSHDRSDTIRRRLLLFDDEDSVRNALSHEILAASNSANGLAIYRHSIHPIELVVTEYCRPGMLGLARACTGLNRELGVRYVPVLRQTSNSRKIFTHVTCFARQESYY